MDAKQIHDIEQLSGYFRRLAGSVAGYYRALLEEGMSEHGALMLAMAHQRDTLSGFYWKVPPEDPPAPHG